MKALTRNSRVHLHVLLTISFFAALVAASRSAAAEVEERIRRVEQGLMPPVMIRGQAAQTMTISEAMKIYQVPGVSVAVIHHGKIEWARGYGVLEAGSNRPVDAETLFQAASISKCVTAMAALALVERGKLALDEDVNSRLTAWKVPDNDFTKVEKVTLRRLLSHTAGLTVHGFPGYATDEPVPSLQAVLDGAKPANTAAIRVDTTPGSGWRYSGGGYCVVQELMIDVTGKPFPLLLKETVLQPLEMGHSTYEQPLPADECGVAASGHTSDGRPIRGKWHVYPEMAAAGLWTTPSDLARFAIELQRGRRSDSNRVISGRMVQQMVKPQRGDAGLGIFVNGSDRSWRFSHGGANEGFRAMMIIYAESGNGAVVMANSDSGADLYNAILRSLAREYEWPDFQPKFRPVTAVDPGVYGPYVGRYQISPEMHLAITLEADKLFAQATGQPKVRLHPDSKTHFFITEGEVEITFLPGDQGKVDELTVTMNGQEIKAKRVEQ